MSTVTALPLHRRLSETRAAIDTLDNATRSWHAFAPNVAAVDAAINQADSIARGLRELRPVIVAEFQPQPPKAA
jgi:hypothetical protein